jgi:hypothetical protein
VLLVHPAVQALSLLGCRSVRVGVRCPALRALSLRNSVVTQLAVTAPALTALDLSGVQKLGDSSLRAVLTRLTGLQRLDLCQNMPLSDDTLREVRSGARTRPPRLPPGRWRRRARAPAPAQASQHLGQLSWLSAASCIGLTLNMVRGFPALRVANFSSCDSLPPSTAVRPAPQPRLSCARPSARERARALPRRRCPRWSPGRRWRS